MHNHPRCGTVWADMRAVPPRHDQSGALGGGELVARRRVRRRGERRRRGGATRSRRWATPSSRCSRTTACSCSPTASAARTAARSRSSGAAATRGWSRPRAAARRARGHHPPVRPEQRRRLHRLLGDCSTPRVARRSLSSRHRPLSRRPSTGRRQDNEGILPVTMFAPEAPTVSFPPLEIAPETFLIQQVQPACGQPLFVYINSLVIRGEEPVIVDTGTPANRDAVARRGVHARGARGRPLGVPVARRRRPHRQPRPGDGGVPERDPRVHVGDGRAPHELLQLPARPLPLGQRRRGVRRRRPSARRRAGRRCGTRPPRAASGTPAPACTGRSTASRLPSSACRSRRSRRSTPSSGSSA